MFTFMSIVLKSEIGSQFIQCLNGIFWCQLLIIYSYTAEIRYTIYFRHPIVFGYNPNILCVCFGRIKNRVSVYSLFKTVFHGVKYLFFKETQQNLGIQYTFYIWIGWTISTALPVQNAFYLIYIRESICWLDTKITQWFAK